MTHKINDLIYPKLSYLIVGLCFDVHNELGRFAKEKKYSELIKEKLKQSNIPFKREQVIGNSGNIVDFIIDDKMILELKAKRILLKEDFLQTQRYLQECRIKLAILVNFRGKYLSPKRIVRIDKKY